MPTYLTPGVYVEEIDTGPKPLAAVATAVAAFVGFTPKAPTDDPSDPMGVKPRLVTNWAQFERLYGGFGAGTMLPHAVYGYFNNGGSLAYIVRVPHTKPAEGHGVLALPAAGESEKPALEVTSLVDDRIEVVLEPGAPPPADEPQTFSVHVRERGVVEESYRDVTLVKGPRQVGTVVNETSTRVRISVLDEKASLPATGRFPIDPPVPEPVAISGADFEGAERARSGIRGLVIADDVTMVSIPDLITAARRDDGSVDLDLWKATQTALINHCENQANRVAVLDAPPGLDPQEMQEWRANIAMYDSAFAAMYYPWIKVTNPAPVNGDKLLAIPPSGHMSGIWARTDESRGVWKAPANEVVRGALDIDVKITDAEQSLLNPIGVNCIRPFGTRGIRVWGARTLASDPSWNYLNVRRLFNMVETSIMRGTQWVVFEPNDLDLWQRVRRTVSGFLTTLWRDGALAGATPEQAFFVKCDAENNPPESVDLGRLIIEVGIAPVKPAEFVIFRISQFQGGSSVE